MNIINGELELWFYFEKKCNRPNTRIAISNRGRVRTMGGSVHLSKYTDIIKMDGELITIYRLLADIFIPKTVEDIELGRNEIDHITHEPEGMNINDVRNLRWCTHDENCNFPERIKKLSKSKKGKKLEPLVLEDRRKRMLTKKTVVRSEFSKKYFEHFGLTRSENKNQYDKEKYWYYNHNRRCSWE